MAIDAEGCICISRTLLKTRTGNDYFGYDLKVSVANTSMKLMRWLVRYFGGEFRPKQKGKLGVEQCFEWFITGGYEKIETMLLGTLPYHIIKREQALIALEWTRMRGKENPTRRAELHAACMALNSGKSVETNTSSIESAIEVAKTEIRLAGLPDPSIDLMKIESDLQGDLQSVPDVNRGSDRCSIPPVGWWCSRPKGHIGPCAARPNQI
jgi:hypothetical protein